MASIKCLDFRDLNWLCMIPQVGGFRGCYPDNHRNSWRCARTVRALCPRCARAVRKRPLMQARPYNSGQILPRRAHGARAVQTLGISGDPPSDNCTHEEACRKEQKRPRSLGDLLAIIKQTLGRRVVCLQIRFSGVLWAVWVSASWDSAPVFDHCWLPRCGRGARAVCAWCARGATTPTKGPKVAYSGAKPPPFDRRTVVAPSSPKNGSHTIFSTEEEGQSDAFVSLSLPITQEVV